MLASGIAAQTDMDGYMADKGLVEVSKLDSSIHVSLRYATADNIFGQPVYSGITGAWLHPDAAAKMLEAARILRHEHPEYSFLVYDAARPMSVQRSMWALVRGTDKTRYVSNPAKGGGMHNYGMAVDVTLTYSSGKPLDMGTSFDYFGKEAWITDEEALLKAGSISRQAYDNRRLLRSVMRRAGFTTILYEWWHFNACLRPTAISKYRVID
jgi:D-alanyl-D-alanine dipeptidase